MHFNEALNPVPAKTVYMGSRIILTTKDGQTIVRPFVNTETMCELGNGLVAQFNQTGAKAWNAGETYLDIDQYFDVYLHKKGVARGIF